MALADFTVSSTSLSAKLSDDPRDAIPVGLSFCPLAVEHAPELLHRTALRCTSCLAYINCYCSIDGDTWKCRHPGCWAMAEKKGTRCPHCGTVRKKPDSGEKRAKLTKQEKELLAEIRELKSGATSVPVPEQPSATSKGQPTRKYHRRLGSIIQLRCLDSAPVSSDSQILAQSGGTGQSGQNI